MSDNGARKHPGADATASGGIKAGEAFRRLLETDPATQAAWKRVRARFQAIVKAFRVFMELDPETRAAWDREWAQLREELADASAAEMQELEARDFPRPETIEDWEHLARIVGLSREEIGNMTVGEIFDEARACADRWSLLFQWAEESRLKVAMQAKALLPAESSIPTGQSRPAEPVGGTSTPTRRKRSTQQGEARVKLIAALTKHHQYANGGCLNLEPIGCNELARMAGVSLGSASIFFAKEFDGYGEYRKCCADRAGLMRALKMLNQKFSPHHLFGVKPPGEDERADES